MRFANLIELARTLRAVVHAHDPDGPAVEFVGEQIGTKEIEITAEPIEHLAEAVDSR